MKQLFVITLALLLVSNHAGAQTIKELSIEPSQVTEGSVFSESCSSPELGVVVFETAISGLWFEMYPPSQLKNMRYNRQRNEYVMCVEPTDGKYRFTITHADFKSVDFFVENIQKNKPQFFKIDPKANPNVEENRGELPLLPRSESSNVTIETPNRLMEVKVTNAELTENGKSFMMEILMTNRGQSISSYILGAHSRKPVAYDNLGNISPIDFYLGDRRIDIIDSLPQNTPVKLRLIISNINSKATFFSSIVFFADCYNYCDEMKGEYIFKNVPIH